MSKVALRVYTREIESLIDQGHVEEAVAHCQHIIKTYPKHLETYRMLGKAYLEARRYNDAVDIFQRVLMAVPDDFVSHLGMSIVRDEQKDLDASIWHMERAFEANPSNAGVQGELRRLYGRRDGLEPPKIRLTRGALAQMYTKGGQYPQAISEIRSVLAEDNSRFEMKVLLARAYFRAGQKLEATEICEELLKQYPFCLDANRILAEILPGTSLAQSVEVYKKRIHALDPYAALATSSAFDSDSVQDQAVTLERLDWEPGMGGESSAWQAEPAPATVTEAPIPDFMKTAGWGPSTGEAHEGPMDFSEEEPAAPAGELAAAEIPDWLKAMAPPSAEQPSIDTGPVAEADLDWLAGLGPVGEAQPAETPSAQDDSADWLAGLGAAAGTAAVTAAAEIPDWLSGLGEETPSEQPAAAGADDDWLKNLAPVAGEAPAAAQPAAETPDWLSGLGEETPSEQPAAAGADDDWLKNLAPVAGEAPAAAQPAAETPDWLSGLGEEAPSEQPAAAGADDDWMKNLAPAGEEPAPSQPAEAAPVADWLKDLSGEEPKGEELSPLVGGPGTNADDQDEAFKWLESLAAGQGAKPEELLTKPEERLEQAPGWVEKVEEAPVSPKTSEPAAYIPEKPVEVEAEPVEGELSPLVASGPGVNADDQDEAFKWLESLAAGQGAKPEELLTKPEERLEQAPQWVEQVENPPTPLSAPVSGPGTSPLDQDKAFKWLENLAAGQGAKSEELLTQPEERLDRAPDWLDQLPAEPGTLAQPALAAEESPVPSWLDSLEMPEQPAEPVAPAAEEETAMGELSGLVSGPGVNADDQDEAFKWLESLAAGQGAKPEELLTKPEERLEQAPQWVEQVGAESAPTAMESAVPSWLDSLEMPEQPAEPVAPAAEEETAMGELSGLVSGPGVNADDQDEAFKWLESLAAGQGAKPEELLTKPEERLEQAPQWVEQVGAESAQAAEPIAPAAEESEVPSWLDSVETPEQPAEPAVESIPAVAESAVPSWLDSLEESGKQEQIGEPLPWESIAAEDETRLEPVSFAPPEAVPESGAGEVTGWLKVLAEEEAAASQPATAAEPSLPNWIQEPTAQAVPAVEEDFPDWLKDEAADEQPAREAPASTWIPAEEPPAPQAVEAAPPPVVSAAPEAVVQPVVEAVPPHLPPEPVPAAAPRPTIRSTGALTMDKDSLALRGAREYLNKGGLDKAMGEYAKLIKRGKLTEEVIYDLQEATYRHPVDVVVWQTLGDAYMRSNRLQEALDAYTKAEELLR
jgi:tetratricopeptide (TPR) repeat protein